MDDVSSPHGGHSLSQDDGGRVNPASAPRRRRSPPSPAEQARRKAWGEQWGKLVSEGYKRMTEERGSDE